MPDVVLQSCRPEPLASYLKALGILKLVGEQLDPTARGAWNGETFTLRSRLDETGLARFFVEEYQPTPILAPWNGGSGFYYKWDAKRGAFKEREACLLVEALAGATHPRFSAFSSAIKSVTRVLRKAVEPIDPAKEDKKALDERMLLKDGDRAFAIPKGGKDAILRRLRAELPDADIQWLDVTVALQSDGQITLPLLGSGGNDGNLEFSVNFMQHLTRLFPLEQGESISPRTAELLDDSLFGRGGVALERGSPGQFDPGGGGGPNAGQGYEGATLLNPWDYVLMLEGALLFAGSIARRNSTAPGRASLPFTVDVTPAGLGSLAAKDAELSRAEMWLPLWQRPMNLRELRRLLAEGRAQAGRAQAATGLDFARAVATLGVDRGISAFVRYVFLQRAGRMFIAVPVGRLSVAEPAPHGRLLDEVAPWVKRASELVSSKEIPASVGVAARRVEEAIFRYCALRQRAGLEDVLAALGALERSIARSPKARASIRPLDGLSEEWRDTVGDSAEASIAAALASIVGPSLRTNLEPVAEVRRAGEPRFQWSSEASSDVAWAGDNLSQNLARILERRMLNAARGAKRQGTSVRDQSDDHEMMTVERRGLAPIYSTQAASLDDIARFVAGDVDDERIADLLWGFAATAHATRKVTSGNANRTVPREYALLKLQFLPVPLQLPPREPLRLAADLALTRLLLTHPDQAADLAVRRLRGAGLIVRGSEARRGKTRALSFLTPVSPERLAAALIIPIFETTKLASLVLRQVEPVEHDSTTTPEETEMSHD